MSEQSSVVGVFATLPAAEGAVKKLDEGKFPSSRFRSWRRIFKTRRRSMDT